MPATPSRIGFIQQEFRRVIAETAAVRTNYGSLARESEDPVPTALDNVADAQTIANERQSLLGVERRRFTLGLNSVNEVLGLSYVGLIPLGRYIDTERGFDKPVIVSEIAVDLGTGSAEATVWG